MSTLKEQQEAKEAAGTMVRAKLIENNEELTKKFNALLDNNNEKILSRLLELFTSIESKFTSLDKNIKELKSDIASNSEKDEAYFNYLKNLISINQANVNNEPFIAPSVKGATKSSESKPRSTKTAAAKAKNTILDAENTKSDAADTKSDAADTKSDAPAPKRKAATKKQDTMDVVPALKSTTFLKHFIKDLDFMQKVFNGEFGDFVTNTVCAEVKSDDLKNVDKAERANHFIEANVDPTSLIKALNKNATFKEFISREFKAWEARVKVDNNKDFLAEDA